MAKLLLSKAKILADQKGAPFLLGQELICDDAGTIYLIKKLSRAMRALIPKVFTHRSQLSSLSNPNAGRCRSGLRCLISAEVLPISISGFLKLFDIILIQKGTGMRS